MYKILFICNRRTDGYGSTIGLMNQANFTSQALNAKGIAVCKSVRVIDSNFIDAEVHKYKPDMVVLEAIWVPPYKLKELVSLYPHIIWNTRLHSNMPFLALEGQAYPWMYEYLELGKTVEITGNNSTLITDLELSLGISVPNLPNIYDFHRKPPHHIQKAI